MNREQIYAALFSYLSGIADFKIAARRLKHWSEVNAADQPALFMVQKGETQQQARRGLPAMWQLSVDVFVYVNAGSDPNVIPAQTINSLLDAFEAALGPAPGADIVANVQTLGGLVSHAWIAGQIEIFDGALGAQSVAIIPIDVLVP